MIPGSVRSVPTMLANNRNHVGAIEFPSTIGFLNQRILSLIYSLVISFLVGPPSNDMGAKLDPAALQSQPKRFDCTMGA